MEWFAFEFFLIAQIQNFRFEKALKWQEVFVIVVDNILAYLHVELVLSW